MWTTNPPSKLIRYLFVLRVNSTLVRLPRYPALEFSHTLGAMIAARLPTLEARRWRKALMPRPASGAALLEVGSETTIADESHHDGQGSGAVTSTPATGQDIPQRAWPLDAILFVYPGKLIYGQGELILWELKLLRDSANHGLFLETLLPAIEAAAVTKEPQWNRPGKLWGHFDLEGLYVARGLQWQPLVKQGQIDLGLPVTPTQWLENVPVTWPDQRLPTHLTWLTPFALGEYSAAELPKQNRRRKQKQRARSVAPPSLTTILQALATRLGPNLPEWRSPKRSSKPSLTWAEVLHEAEKTVVLQHELQHPGKLVPGQGIGRQRFSGIPRSAVPYLMLASMLHIGDYTHVGCGTFSLSK